MEGVATDFVKYLQSFAANSDFNAKSVGNFFIEHNSQLIYHISIKHVTFKLCFKIGRASKISTLTLNITFKLVNNLH